MSRSFISSRLISSSRRLISGSASSVIGLISVGVGRRGLIISGIGVIVTRRSSSIGSMSVRFVFVYNIVISST